MKLNFSKGYSYLLVFAPIFALLAFQIISLFVKIPYGNTFGITCLLITVGIFTCYLTQFYIGISYFKAIQQRNHLFICVGIIALLFILLAAHAIVYGWTGYEKMQHTGPISHTSKSQSIVVNAISILSVYTLLSYLIVNNQLVRWNFNKRPPEKKTQDLKNEYLQPMKKVVRISVLLFFISIIIGLVQDILRMQKL